MANSKLVLYDSIRQIFLLCLIITVIGIVLSLFFKDPLSRRSVSDATELTEQNIIKEQLISGRYTILLV